MRYAILVLFFVMIIAQWYVPFSMIKEQEKVLSDGQVFKFKTQPIDPSDPFRGKYITLRFAETTVEVDTTIAFAPGEGVYVEIFEGNDGFAKIKSVTREEPVQTANYFKAHVGYPVNASLIDIEYPFDRFYLEESKASEAEQAYWQANSDTTQIAYALVAIKDGQSALKEVMINDKNIIEVVHELNEN